MSSHVIPPPSYLMRHDFSVKEINRALYEIAKMIKKDFENFVRTWENKPKFTIEKEGAGYLILAKPGEGHNDLFSYVAEGTRVRRALLSPNWKSKTHERQLFSVQGQGHVIAVSRKFNFKGIKGRHPEEEIAKKYDDRTISNLVSKYVQQAMK